MQLIVTKFFLKIEINFEMVNCESITIDNRHHSSVQYTKGVFFFFK